jgi:outer membrane protein assembly factor BamB
VLGVSAALLASTPPAAAQLATSAWPMLQHDPRHSGRSPLPGPHFPPEGPAPGDVVVWTGFDKVKSSPTIAPDGTIYVGLGWSVCAIAPEVIDGVLEERWCRRLVADASPSSAAIGADGTIYIGDRGNTINAIDPGGHLVWQYRHGSEGDVKTSPVIGPTGTIYVGFSQNLDGPGSLAALNPGEPPPAGAGGTLRWSYSGGNFVSTSSPALDDGVIYFGDLRGWLHAVRAETGALLWKLKIGNEISASPVITPEGARVYVGSTDGLSAVDLATRSIEWTFPTDGMVDQTPALAADGTIYAGARAAKRSTLYAVDPGGALEWAFGPIQVDANDGPFAIVGGDGTIYAAIGRTVYALRPIDGAVLWSYTVPMNIISFPALGNASPETGGTAVLYIPSHDGNVYALRGLPPTFTDVGGNHPFFRFIEALFRAGITGGCGTAPARYCPDAPVTRGQMAVFLLRGVAWPGAANPPRPTGTVFADVAVDHPFAAWIEQLAATGITGGCATAPPRYCSEATVTRGQMAVFLLRAAHGPGYEPPAAAGMFADVPVDHVFAPWIEQLAREGITGGCGTNPARYCPEAPVTRGQMAVFLVRTLQLPI